jgi:hypothetical protein
VALFWAAGGRFDDLARTHSDMDGDPAVGVSVDQSISNGLIDAEQVDLEDCCRSVADEKLGPFFASPERLLEAVAPAISAPIIRTGGGIAPSVAAA